MSAAARATSEFRLRFGANPTLLVRAPGRVNLIGEHTDYNDGWVLPMAIDRDVSIALRARPDARVLVHSLEFDQDAAFDLSALARTPSPARVLARPPGGAGPGWEAYVEGVGWALEQAGIGVTGWEGVLAGDVPLGAGLSSSAAVEMAVLEAFVAVAGVSFTALDAARLCRRVENEWVGVSSGIMDPLSVAAGRRDHALLIDCRSLDVQPVPLPPEAAILVLDTGTRRGLVDSAYNERRRQCEAAARFFGVPALRDVDASMLAARGHDLDPVILRRARHVVTENRRTLEAAGALRAGDLRRFGRLMDASHASLRDDFEVTGEVLDAMVATARSLPGCLGARMTGAGFGGCAIALVAAAAAERFAGDVARRYRDATGVEARAYRCRAADGAGVARVTPP
jgi:galactokinase